MHKEKMWVLLNVDLLQKKICIQRKNYEPIIELLTIFVFWHSSIHWAKSGKVSIFPWILLDWCTNDEEMELMYQSYEMVTPRWKLMYENRVSSAVNVFHCYYSMTLFFSFVNCKDENWSLEEWFENYQVT